MYTADLCDEFAAEITVCQADLKPFGGRRRFSGPIATVKVFEDNVLVKQALETVPAGSVLVVDGGGSRNCALLGDNLATIGHNRGLAGIIIYGCVRDSVALATIDIGILALGTHPMKSQKLGQGETQTVLHFGGVIWNPGQIVYIDEDGVIIAPRVLQ